MEVTFLITFLWQRGQKGAQQMENAFLHFPVSLDVSMATHHMLRDWHKNLSVEKISFFHNITMCPS